MLEVFTQGVQLMQTGRTGPAERGHAWHPADACSCLRTGASRSGGRQLGSFRALLEFSVPLRSTARCRSAVMVCPLTACPFAPRLT
jgi:hypothetical protein